MANVLLGAELPRDEFLKRARNFVDGERRHMAAEERVFFPAALENLTEEDWRDIDQRVAKFADPLHSVKAIGRFEVLQRELSAARH